ncbi:auxin-induced in root cultures protein 12-like [Panicum miliaceum]|uniref:Auxin-induced in root cultures protein 12-like n=1 Tax=Panicum miliaceum TaxID=4540 RepID=A0A3L6Q9D1_PANMI|nr:auxin-induced in root cultures protein 12-like [Panicum miliaceum]
MAQPCVVVVLSRVKKMHPWPSDEMPMATIVSISSARHAALDLRRQDAGRQRRGWVSLALNPTGNGKRGAQALVAFKGGQLPAYAVNTYNLTGHRALDGDPTPIAYRAMDLAADESSGKVHLYGKMQLHQRMEVVNHIWNVRSSVPSGYNFFC